MKRSLSVILITGFKAVSAFLAVSLFGFFVLASRLHEITDDVWSRLGVQLPEVNLNIKFSCFDGSFHYQGVKNAKNIAENERAEIINQIVAYAKKYVASKEFSDLYKQERARHKPADAYALLPANAETIKAEEKARLEKDLKIAEDGLNSPNPKIKNGAPLRIENIKKEIAALDDPNNKKIRARLDQIRQQNDNATKMNNEQMQKYEAAWPEDVRLLIKKRLQEILDITADVDFNAETTVSSKGLKTFVNPEYEKKSKEWKLAFRAGKSATNAVRAAAQQWLKELK